VSRPAWTSALAGACKEARAWAYDYETPESAWAACHRGDWLLWIAARLATDRKPVAMAACACARLSLKYVPTSELRPLQCIEVTEAWCRGEATLTDVRKTRASAYASSAFYASSASADAAYAAYAASAAYAAYAAYADAAYASSSASSASSAAYAAYAAADADADAARSTTLAECADIVRRMVPMPAVAT
jgi:hypothetical protein